MKIQEYLKIKDIPMKAFASRLDITLSYLRHLCCGYRNPSVSLSKKIFKMTEGMVTIPEIRKCTMHCTDGCPCGAGNDKP